MPEVVAVVGPTATGKSDLAVRLAQQLDGEVVNADSMQLYRGMDLGTAKLSPEERGGVPHHLLDIWPVTHPASVADYQQRARAVIDEVRGRGRLPIVVGGSGLYVRAALDPLEFPGTDTQVRARLEAELDANGPESLHERLRQHDPAAALAILPSNGRRIVRALEVIELTGRPFTAALPSYDADHGSVYDAVLIGLDLDDGHLDRRVDERVERMFSAGLVEEVRALEAQGLREGRTAGRALGYRQVLEMFDGLLPESQVREVTARATRRFVRRQRSWFRRDPRIVWLDASHDVLDAALRVI